MGPLTHSDRGWRGALARSLVPRPAPGNQPLIVDDAVWLSVTSRVSCTPWQTGRGGAVATARRMARSPARARRRRVVFVATESGAAYGLEPADGRGPVASRPARRHEPLVAATTDAVYLGVRRVLAALRTCDGSIAWLRGGRRRGRRRSRTAWSSRRRPRWRRRSLGRSWPRGCRGTERWRRASADRRGDLHAAVRGGRAWVVAEDETVVALERDRIGRLECDHRCAERRVAGVWEPTVFVATTGGTLQALDTETGHSVAGRDLGSAVRADRLGGSSRWHERRRPVRLRRPGP